MSRCFQSTFHKLDGYGCKNALSTRSFATLPQPPRSRRRKDEQTNVTPIPRTHLNLWETTTGGVTRTRGRGPSTNNRLETANVLRTVSPVLENERIPSLCEQSSNGPNDLRLPGSSDTAIGRLAKLLSPTRSSACSDVASIENLISLYKTVSKQSLLQHLSTEQMTEVLSICGTLSLPLPRLSSVYDSRLVPFFQPPSGNTNYWSFVLKAAKDKDRLSHNLTLQDRYWVMRACLARISHVEGGRIYSDRLREFLVHARLQYDILKLDTDNPDVHLPYFRALFSLKDTDYLHHAAFNLCHYIEQHSNPPRSFPDLLWRLISVHGHRLSLGLKERICSLLFSRIGKPFIARTTPEFISLDSDHILGISRLNAALLATMFRCYSSQFPPGFLQHWAVKEARRALSPTLDLEIRWNNLLLLSTHMFFGVIRLNSVTSPGPNNIHWRTTLTLGTVNEALSSAGHDLGSVSEYVQGICHPLWQMWKENTAEQTPYPIDIVRAYVSAFLRIAAKSKDIRLKDDCFLYCQQHVLWVYRQDNTPSMKSQAIDTIVAYILADISCTKSSWPDLYRVIARVLPDTSWQDDVTSVLLHYYALQNISIAYNLYLYSKENAIAASSSSLHTLGLSLASFEQWSLLAPILENETFSREQTERLLGAYLRVFQVRRHQYADQSFVSLLGRIANKLYDQAPPSPLLKYPLRYFFSIMIATDNSSDAIKLIMAIHRTTPAFFTMRLVLRLILQLVRRKQLSNAVFLYNLFRHRPPSPSLDDIRRKLTLKLFQAGSRKLAQRADRTRHGRSTLAVRESLARAVDFRTVPSSKSIYRDILPGVALSPIHGPTIRHAVSLLIRAKRLFLARKLYRDSLPHLDLKTKTAIGNIILHGPMYGLDIRNGRLVRHVLRTKDLLVDEFGFVPDRTTVNIIIKAMLRWRSMFDASHVKQIFDQMVHQGYPVPERWRHKHRVPFNTPQSATSGLSGMTLPPFISFTRHIRPMYKLFIKALYLRNDRAAAKMIIGILKVVEIQHIRELEKRNRARREGIVKKKLKM